MDLKTSQESVIAKSATTLDTVMRLADGNTSDNYQIGVYDLLNAVTLTSAQAITLLTTPNSIILDSKYKITTLGITGVTEVIISGRNMIQGNSPAEALVTALGVYVPCTYDVATNTVRLDYLLWAGHLTQSGTSAPTIDLVNYNISGETPTMTYASEGIYGITFSTGKLVDANAVKHFSYIYEGDQQGFYSIEGTSGADAVIKCFRNGAAADDRLNSAYIEIRLVYTP
jgi:hypothetical protein